MRNRFNYEVLPGSDVVVLNFILDGFYRLFEIDLSGFKRDVLLNDRDLSSTTLLNLWNKTKARTSISDSIEQIKKFLLQLIKPSEAQKIGLLHHEEFLSRFVINTLHKVPNTATVSNRTVQINFRKYFGYSVKEKNRYERFKQVILYILSSNTSSVKWVEIIRQFEYYDYSHLYKDFRKFLSTTPEDFLQDVNDFCIPKYCY